MFCSKYTFKIPNWDNMDILHCTMGVCGNRGVCVQWKWKGILTLYRLCPLGVSHAWTVHFIGHLVNYLKNLGCTADKFFKG